MYSEVARKLLPLTSNLDKFKASFADLDKRMDKLFLGEWNNLVEPGPNVNQFITEWSIDSSVLGDSAVQACFASFGSILPGVHVLWGRNPHVGSMDWTAGVHGHLMGLRLVPGYPLCGDQSGGSTGWCRHGSPPFKGRDCLRCSLCHRLPPSEHFTIILIRSMSDIP